MPRPSDTSYKVVEEERGRRLCRQPTLTGLAGPPRTGGIVATMAPITKARTPAADFLGSRLAGHGVVFSVDAEASLIIVRPNSMKETSYCQTAAQQTELKFPGWDVLVQDAGRGDAMKSLVERERAAADPLAG